MFYFSHGGAYPYVDEEACDKAWEDYFLTLRGSAGTQAGVQ